jgi:hypothetical protein
VNIAVDSKLLVLTAEPTPDDSRTKRGVPQPPRLFCGLTVAGRPELHT